jgi:hypothetical protein
MLTHIRPPDATAFTLIESICRTCCRTCHLGGLSNYLRHMSGFNAVAEPAIYNVGGVAYPRGHRRCRHGGAAPASSPASLARRSTKSRSMLATCRAPRRAAPRPVLAGADRCGVFGIGNNEFPIPIRRAFTMPMGGAVVNPGEALSGASGACAAPTARPGREGDKSSLSRRQAMGGRPSTFGIYPGRRSQRHMRSRWRCRRRCDRSQSARRFL